MHSAIATYMHNPTRKRACQPLVTLQRQSSLYDPGAEQLIVVGVQSHEPVTLPRLPLRQRNLVDAKTEVTMMLGITRYIFGTSR
jgi:hypothetical protein